MSIAARNAILAGAALPYDAEVEYLESTGTQYIDADYIPTIDSKMELDIMCLSQNSSYTGVAFCGNYFNSAHVFGLGRNSGNGLIGYFGNKSNVNLTRTFYVNVRYKTSINKDTLSCTNVETQASTSTTMGVTSFGTSSRSLYLLNGNTMTGDLRIHANWKLFGCKLFSQSSLVRDFIPVRVGSGAEAVGYMYDRVSGELFGNAGTGAFVIGPDASAANGGGGV